MRALDHFAQACALRLALSAAVRAARIEALMLRSSVLDATGGLRDLCEAISTAASAASDLLLVPMYDQPKAARRRRSTGGQFKRRGRKLGVRS